MPTQPMSLKDFFKNMGNGFVAKTNTLPNGGGTYQSPTPNMSVAPANMSVAPLGPVNASTIKPETASPVVSPKTTTPIFSGKKTTDTPAPGSTAPQTTLDYSKYINPVTGVPYTPQEYSDVVAKRVTGGAVPSYAGNAIQNPNQTEEELKTTARGLNNARNDIATGTTDPYKVASQSGIQYTPQELSAIEKAYAGVYDPAINDVFTKLDLKQKADAAEKTRLDNIAKSELESKNKLKEMAVQHGYDMELKKTPSGDSVGSAGGGTGEFANTIDLVAGMESSVYQKKETAKNLRAMIDSKDYVSAYSQIANSIENQLVGESKQKFVNARTDYGVLGKMRDAVQKYADGGGDMGLIKGTEEEIKRKLGIDSGKASALAVYLWKEFQTYRNNMTGAAFGAAESRDYAAVNPTLGKSLDLNLSVIDGAQEQLKNRVVETIDQRVPSAKYIREYAEGAVAGENPTASQYKIGQVISGADGKQYKITGLSDPNDPDVEPI